MLVSTFGCYFPIIIFHKYILMRYWEVFSCPFIRYHYYYNQSQSILYISVLKLWPFTHVSSSFWIKIRTRTRLKLNENEERTFRNDILWPFIYLKKSESSWKFSLHFYLILITCLFWFWIFKKMKNEPYHVNKNEPLNVQ